MDVGTSRPAGGTADRHEAGVISLIGCDIIQPAGCGRHEDIYSAYIYSDGQKRLTGTSEDGQRIVYELTCIQTHTHKSPAVSHEA